MTFATESQRDDVGIRFSVVLHGTPYIFLDADLPIGPDGVSWSLPTSGGQSYQIVKNSLDLSNGLRHNSGQIRRRDGRSTPGAASVVIRDNDDNDCLSIFAAENANGNQATLSADMPYDVDGSGSVIVTDNISSGWPASGLAFIGLECLYYPVKTSTDFGSSGSKCTRDLFSVGQCDTRHVQNASHPGSAPRTISDYIECWYNRPISIFAHIVGSAGNFYDSAFSLPGDVKSYSREIYRGVIQTVAPAPDYLSWSIKTRAIDAIIHTELGQDPIKAKFFKNQLGHTKPGTEQIALYLTDDQLSVDVNVKKWASMADKASGEDPDNDVDISVGLSTPLNVFTQESLESVFSAEMLADVTGYSSGGTPFSGLSISLSRKSDNLPGALWILSVMSADSAAYSVTFNFSADEGIGLPLGFLGPAYTATVSGVSGLKQIHADRRGYAVFVGEKATEIPFFYDGTEGIVTDSPAAPGYVKLDSEIIYYDAISSSSAVIDGLHRLTGCRRGRMGTIARNHFIEPGQDADDVSMVFGVGFEDLETDSGVSIFDAWRQALVSTGSGHHGAYDTLGRVGPGVSPSHFDNQKIDSIRDGFVGWQKNIKLFISKPVDLMKLAKGWFSALGLYATSRPNKSGEFLITLDQVIPPLESETVASITASDLSIDDPARHKNATSKPVTSVKLQHRWNVASEKFDEDWVTVNNPNAVSQYQVKSSLSIPLIGYTLDASTAYMMGVWMASRIWDRYSSIYEVISLKVVSRAGWMIKPGDCVLVTCPGIPTALGARGFSSRPMVCVEASHIYWAQSAEVSSTLVCVNEVFVRRSTYSPTASVVSNSSGVLTLDNDIYSPDDLSHFDSGDEVILFEPGNYSATKASGSVVSKGVGTITVSGSAASYSPTANTRLVSAAYSTASSSQKNHVYISSSATPSVLTVEDKTAFKYV